MIRCRVVCSFRLFSFWKDGLRGRYTIIDVLDVAHGIIYLLLKYRSVVLYATIVLCNIKMR
jgi:hypothetical protein